MTWFRSKAKFGNKKEEYSGRTFDSGLERAVFKMLETLEKAGEIKIIRQQAQIELLSRPARVCYRADFEVQDVKSREIFWVEAKGYPTEVWNIKKKLWYWFGPGRLEIYCGSKANFKLTETILGPSKR